MGKSFSQREKVVKNKHSQARRGVDAERGAVFFYILVNPGRQ